MFGIHHNTQLKEYYYYEDGIVINYPYNNIDKIIVYDKTYNDYRNYLLKYGKQLYNLKLNGLLSDGLKIFVFPIYTAEYKVTYNNETYIIFEPALINVIYLKHIMDICDNALNLLIRKKHIKYYFEKNSISRYVRISDVIDVLKKFNGSHANTLNILIILLESYNKHLINNIS